MSYLFTFLEGFASFISPCILPLLPIYIAYFTGSESKKSKAFINAIAFVMGFSSIFILFALIANRIGNALLIYKKSIKITFGIIVILFGLNYMELLNLKIFTKMRKINIDVSNLNFVRSFIFGILFSISFSPCVGTFLSSALLLIASEQNVTKGIIMIILYCIGLGLPFIISSILIDKLKNVFNFIKKNFKTIKNTSGIILIIMGIYLIFF